MFNEGGYGKYDFIIWVVKFYTWDQLLWEKVRLIGQPYHTQNETEVKYFDLPSERTMRQGVDNTCLEAVDLHTALKIPLV